MFSGAHPQWLNHCTIQLDTATSKVRQTIKQLAVKGDVKSARILAREVVRSDRQKDRLSVSKARLGSIGSQLSQQLGSYNNLRIPRLVYTNSLIRNEAMIKVTGSLQKSTEIMKLSSALIKLPQIGQAMREMSMEMTKVIHRTYTNARSLTIVFVNRLELWRR
jgi:charged multivesicular body protein 3